VVFSIRKLQALLSIAIVLFLFQKPAISETRFSTTFRTPRFILHIDHSREAVDMEKFNAKDVANQAIETLNKTYEELSRIFRAKPSSKVVLRFLSPLEFQKQTGAPEWTWLDEGVAQILEGPANPLLGPALREWISENKSIPLSDLENGFTTLDDGMVPVAYAESLFVTRSLIRKKGFSSIVDYLKNLKAGMDSKRAFRVAFGTSLATFESKLTKRIKIWADSGREDP